MLSCHSFLDQLCICWSIWHPCIFGGAAHKHTNTRCSSRVLVCTMKFAELSNSYIHLISLRDLNAPTQKRILKNIFLWESIGLQGLGQHLRHIPDNVEVEKLIYSLHNKNLDGVTQSWLTVRLNRRIRSIEAHNRILASSCLSHALSGSENWTRLCKVICIFRCHKIVWYLTTIRR